MQKYTFQDFNRDFPDDAACLEWLHTSLYPEGIFCKKCLRVTKHHRVACRPSYSCDFCGNHVHPTADTIFHKSPTPLRIWFYAVYLMASTRCGVSAKQIERETGVTYKTAWRMFNRIRSLLQEDDETLGGDVETDETYMGGEAKWMHKDKKAERIHGRGTAGKQPVFGIARRNTTTQASKIVAKVVSDATADTLVRHITERVLPESMIYTDELRSYDRLGDHGYTHERVNHSQGVYVRGDAHTHTNSV